MKKPLEIVEEFMRLTNEVHDIEGAVELMDEDIKFIGPAAQCNNKQEYRALLEQFIPMHTGWKKHQTFEKDDEVCFIEDIYISTPDQTKITLEISEWFKISKGKIQVHKVYYDPTEFMAAFGKS